MDQLIQQLETVPMIVRLLVLAAAGAVIGGQLNRAIYGWAHFRRAIGPWTRPDPLAPPRRWGDRIPILGWIFLRRETCHPPGYWVRPLVIECFVAAAAPALYWFELQGGLYPDWVSRVSTTAVHLQYVSHLVLLLLLVIATFIDFDEMLIPDRVTVTGTVLALALAAAFPQSLLPHCYEHPYRGPVVSQLVLTSSTINEQLWDDGLGGPSSWPPELNGGRGLAYGLACLWGWCLAIVPIVWYPRHGVRRAVRHLLIHIGHKGRWVAPTLMAVAGPIAVVLLWQQGGDRWQSLLSALVGMVAGGGLVWAVRIIGSWALKKEAMGFGDVTLMAMVGAFVGWQGALITFFVAPFAALAITVCAVLLAPNKPIPFGPYLAFGAIATIVGWVAIWGRIEAYFQLGLFMPTVIGCCLLMLGGMLSLWRMIKGIVTE